jgi:hypothetical protein
VAERPVITPRNTKYAVANLIERVETTQKTIDHWLGQEFEWGVADCGQMVGWHLEQTGMTTPLKDARAYTTDIGAKRAMRALGADSMEDFIDRLGFERIAPAMAIVGDIVGLPGGTDDDQWTALAIHTGQDKILAFAAAEGDVARVHSGSASVATIAWRVS